MEAADLKNAELIDSILDAVLSRVRSGQYFNIEEYCQQYPDLADELRVILPALATLEKPHQGSTSPIPDAALPSARIPLNLADFQIISEIGRGAMGVVYEAIQHPLERRVALKVIFGTAPSNASHPLRFQREAEIAARLHHTNIIPVFEAGTSGGHIYYAMQLIEGANLQQLIVAQGSPIEGEQVAPQRSRSSRFDETVGKSGSTEDDQKPVISRTPPRTTPIAVELEPQVCARIALQVAEGLDFAHQRGIVHRDIKPSNILLDHDGRVWIADFGLAKSSGGADLTATGDVVGTIRYLAPERFHGQSDHRSDIYALGLTLYEMLELQPAWPGLDRAQQVQQIVSGNGFRIPGQPAQCTGELRRIVEKSTARDPVSRYQSAGQLAEDLRRYLDGRPVLARKQSALRNLLFWTKRNPLAASLVATTSLALITGTVVALVLASNWRSASIRERANGLAATNSANEAIAETVRSKELSKLTTGALQEMTSQVVSDVLSSKESLTEQQRDFLKKVLQFNHQLVDLSRVDTDSRVQNAKAHNSISVIHNTLGDRQRALEDIKSSVSIWKELIAAFPDKIEFKVEIANALVKQGQYLFVNSDFDPAMDCFLNARDFIGKFADDREMGDLVNLNLGTIDREIANVFNAYDDFSKAIETYERAIQSQLLLLNDKPADPDIRDCLGRLFRDLSHSLLRNGEFPKARVAAESAIQYYLGLCDDFPKTARYHLQLAWSKIALGQVYSGMGEQKEAIRLFDEAQPRLDQQARDRPSVPDFRLDQADRLELIAEAQEKIDQIDDAIRLNKDAMEIRQQVVDSAPDLANARLELAITQYRLAFRLKSNQPDAALKWAEAGAENCRILIENNASVPKYREILSHLVKIKGLILSDQNKLVEALPSWLESERVLAQLLKDNPDDGSLIVTNGIACNDIGMILVKMEKVQEALLWFSKAIELLKKNAHSNSVHSGTIVNLRDAFLKRGNALFDIKKYADAIPDWEQVLELETGNSMRTDMEINIALCHARIRQPESALEYLAKITPARDATLQQHRIMARVFVVLAGQELDETRRSEHLESAARQLLVANSGDPDKVALLKSDDDFKKFWELVNPVR